MKSINYETLKQPMKQVQGMVQGDKIIVTKQSPREGKLISASLKLKHLLHGGIGNVETKMLWGN